MKLARNIKKMIFKEKNFLYKVIFYQILMLFNFLKFSYVSFDVSEHFFFLTPKNLENLHKTIEKPYSNLHFKYHDHSFLK